MDVKITSSGRFHYKKACGKESHYHNDYQIQLVYAGSSLMVLDGEQFSIFPGDIVLSRKGSTHAFQTISQEGVKMLEVKFITLDHELEDILKGIKTKFEDQDRQLFSLLSRLVLEGQRKALNYKIMSGTLLMECLLLMYRICMKSSIPVFESFPLHREARPPGSSPLHPLDLVDEYIHSNLEHSFTLHDLSVACGYNQDYLYRVIKNRTGLSAIKYINLVKFEKALFLIQNTEQTLSEIAWHLGFENLQYFSRFFKHHSGITPSEYIAKVRLTTRTDY